MNRSNHLYAGIAFIVACIVLACVFYAAAVGGRSADNSAAGAAEPAIDNTMTTDMNSTEGAEDLLDPASSPSSAQRVDASDGGEGQPEFGACVAGECSWSKTRSSSLIRSEGDARLFELTLLGGSSVYGDEETPIRWNAAPHRVWVFCSTALPATIIRSGSGWQVDVLDLVDGVPNVLAASAAIYNRTCHPGDDRVDGEAASLGYKGFDGSEPAITIGNPAEMFERSRAFSASAAGQTPS